MKAMNRISFIICGVMALGALPASAQMDNVVEVETNYRPTVKDADKINVMPKSEAMSTTHYSVDYSSKPTFTDRYAFQPMWAARNPQLLRSDKKMFATFGYGTEGNVYGRLAGQLDLKGGNSLHVDYSTQGFNTTLKQYQALKDMEEWDGRFYTTGLDLSFSHRFGNGAELNISGDYQLDVFNYQPDYDCIGVVNTDKQHNDIYGATIELTPCEFGNFAIAADADYHHFGQKYRVNPDDKYSEDIVEAGLVPEYDFGNGIKIDAELGFEYTKYGTRYLEGHTAFDATPHFCYTSDAIGLKAGVYVNNELDIAPDVEFTYHVSPRFDFYLKAAGGETAQNMRTFRRMSPYFTLDATSETGTYATGSTTTDNLELDNSFDQLMGRAGVRFTPLDGLYLDLSACYDLRENVAEITNAPLGLPLVYNPITFADHKRFHAHADLDYQWEDRVSIFLKNEYNKYDWDGDRTFIWRPVLNADWNVTARLIDQLRLGVSFVYQSFDDVTEGTKVYERRDVMNLGASLTYTFPFHLTLYAKADNLLGRDYAPYLNYQTMDRNFMFGAAITF